LTYRRKNNVKKDFGSNSIHFYSYPASGVAVEKSNKGAGKSYSFITI
jgi:hypothetical protein